MVVFLQPASKVFVAVSIIALQLSLESYLELPLSTTIDSKPLQPEKALPRIEVTELGMVTLVKPLQSSKALSPIEVTKKHHYIVSLLSIQYIITSINQYIIKD